MRAELVQRLRDHLDPGAIDKRIPVAGFAEDDVDVVVRCWGEEFRDVGAARSIEYDTYDIGVGAKPGEEAAILRRDFVSRRRPRG
jgi:hypothetical protein